jgi:hypothetical protein
MYNNKLSRKVQNFVLSNKLLEVLVGKMLGDLGTERRNKNCNTRLQFKQTLKQKEYIEHLYDLFKDFCKSPPFIINGVDKRPNRNPNYSAIKFNTRSLPCFNKLREMFYNEEGKKIVPENIGELLTARSLCYWFCDDGYKTVSGLYLCTESFTKEENELLVKVLKDKFNVICSVHKHTNGHRVHISSKSKIHFISLIKPYILKIFEYKIN